MKNKKNNHSMIKRLMKRNLKEHVFRGFLFVFVVVALTGVITALNILCTSSYYNTQSFYLQQYGSKGHIHIDDLSADLKTKIKNYEEVEGIGISAYIGNVINEELHGKPVEIRYADKNYADYVFSTPEEGRMPDSEDEIAIDTTLLNDFGIEDGLGKAITLIWEENEQIMQKSFKIVGIWKESNVVPKHLIWASDTLLNKSIEDENDTEILLKTNKSEILEDFVKDTGIEKTNFRINEVYSDGITYSIKQDALVYKVGIIAVLVCAFLILHSILHIAYITDTKLYARMKILGATPKQIRKSVFEQNLLLGIPGILIGMAMGLAGVKILLPIFFAGIKIVPKIYLVYQDFIISTILVVLTIIIAAVGPARAAGKINPSDLLNEEDNIYFNNKSERRLPGLPVLFQMALYNIGRNKKKNMVVIILLIFGIIGISSLYVVQKSFDIQVYMDEVALGDFTLSERTLVDSWGEYDEKGNTISQEVIKEVENLPGIYETGTLYSQDISLNLSNRAYENITRYYEQNDGEILEYMEQSIGWTEGYNKLKADHICPTTIFGVDGLIIDKLTDEERLLEGKINKEKFLSGNYILAQGMEGIEESYEHPTYSVGDKIEINGKEYEVMAIISAPYSVTEGKINPGYEFSLQFFMPSNQFCQLYPENTARKYVLNVTENEKKTVQSFLDSYAEKNNIPLSSQKSIEKEYYEETRASLMIMNIITIMILVIGIINMSNAMITSVNIRKKEFAMMQGIGMTKKQLKILLVFESVGLVIITLLISFFLDILAISIGVREYLKIQWTASYNFTITPLLIITPVLLIIAFVVPVLCFNHIQKREIMDQLNDTEE